MTTPVCIAVNGASGRMGRSIIDAMRDDARFMLAAALTHGGSADLGKPVGAQSDLTFTDNWRGVAANVVIDFSTAAGFDVALAHCRDNGLALVTGTTGLDAARLGQLKQAAESIPIFFASNFSLGIAVLTRLVREASAALAAWDLEIVEAHHRNKVDAPSGTALSLGEAAAEGRGVALDDVAVHGRHGHVGVRGHGDIGFAVVRGGDIVGEHSILLIGDGERLELTHRATNRALFSHGALEAAAWLAGRPAGYYGMDDLLARH